MTTLAIYWLMPAPQRTAPRARHASESSEDHLERIQELMEEKGFARVSDLAERLGVARASVTNMIQRLAQRGLINYERYRGFTLTDEGRAVAQAVKERHQVLTEFFLLLGLEARVVQAEVEEIEHHLKPASLAALKRLCEHWRAKPAAHRQYLQHGQKAKRS
ncbi:MAG: MarR family transcriptional regulator [Verrucomicrobia bacterium]|nr:MarR family transcriptional regulator [Verrucomicrobiota bacterium]